MNLVIDKEIIIEDSHVAINLMERDSHFFHIIGNLYNCNMIGRGNLIRITGEELQVEKVIQLIYEMKMSVNRPEKNKGKEVMFLTPAGELKKIKLP